MKNLLLITAVLFALTSKAQKIATFKNGGEDKSFNLQTWENGSYQLNIETTSFDSGVGFIIMAIKDRDVNDFVDFLEHCYNKFVSYEKIKVENDVKEYDKYLKKTTFVYYYWSWFDKQYRSRTQAVKANYNISNGYSYFSIGTWGEIDAIEGIGVNSSHLVFSSPEQLREFIALFDTEKFKQIHNENKKKDKLFKD